MSPKKKKNEISNALFQKRIAEIWHQGFDGEKLH